MDFILFALSVFMITSIIDTFECRRERKITQKKIVKLEDEIIQIRQDHQDLSDYVHNDIKNTIDL
jgi:hypothetical protein